MTEYFFVINPQFKMLKSLNDLPGWDLLNDSVKPNNPKQNLWADGIYYVHFKILDGSFYYEYTNCMKL